MIRKLVLFTVLGAFGLSGCGYHLRGTHQLPADVESVHVQSASGALLGEMYLVLESGGVRIASSPGPRTMTIRIENESFDERLLSVDPRDGKAREFELAYTLRFSAADESGKVILPPQSLTLVRDYVFDRDAVIGKSRERWVLETEMRRDAVRQVLYRLSAAR